MRERKSKRQVAVAVPDLWAGGCTESNFAQEDFVVFESFTYRVGSVVKAIAFGLKESMGGIEDFRASQRNRR
jgi:hypothetical protein